MANIVQGITSLIGHTPLMEVGNIERQLSLQARVLVKLEYLNPAGSVKDRAALYMIEDAEAKGLLKEGSVIIEPTSGNTGIGLAAIAASRGYRMILTMPDTMSVERQNILKAYGAQVVLTEGARGMSGAVAKAEELAGYGRESRYLYCRRRYRRYSDGCRRISEKAESFCSDRGAGARGFTPFVKRTGRSAQAAGHRRKLHPEPAQSEDR